MLTAARSRQASIAFLICCFDDVELDLLGGERMIGGQRPAAARPVRRGAAAASFSSRSSCSDLRGERFPIVLQAADRVGGQQRREVGFGAVLADGGGDFARRGGSLLAQLFGFVELGGQLPQLVLVGDAAFLEQRFATAALKPIAAWACFDCFGLELPWPACARSTRGGSTRCVCLWYSARR